MPSWNGRFYFLRPPTLPNRTERCASFKECFMCIQKGRFPICLEVAFGLWPWESQRALRHSSEFPDITTSPRPAGRDPRSEPAAATSLAPKPAPQAAFSSRSWSCRSWKAHICCPGHKQFTLPLPRAAVPAPRRERIVVVCLCLLKLGREKRPPSQDCLECTGRCADGSVSKLRKRAGRPGTRPRSGPARPGARCRRELGPAAPGQRSLLCRCHPALSQFAA